MVGAKRSGDLHPRAVPGRARDDDERGARLLADHGLGQPLLARALNEHRGVIAHAAVEQRPFDPVGHRRRQPRQFRRHALRHMVEDGVPGKVHVLGKASPEMGGHVGCGVSVADRAGVVAPVGVFAVTVLAQMAPLAFAARDVVLDEDQVSFLEALAFGELAARLVDVADVLVPHDHRRARRRLLVQPDVGSADSRDLHLQQGAVLPRYPASETRGSRSCSGRL